VTFAHAEHRDSPSGLMIQVLDLVEVARAVSGHRIRAERVGATTQITVPESGETYATPEDLARVSDEICLDDTIRRLGDDAYLCFAR
jgi:hypothetical protein